MANAVTSFRINVNTNFGSAYVGIGEVKARNSLGGYIPLAGATITAESYYPGHPPSVLIDGLSANENTWYNDSTTIIADQWVNFALPSASDIVSVEIVNTSLNPYGYALKAGSIVATHTGGGTTSVSFNRPSDEPNATTSHTIPAPVSFSVIASLPPMATLPLLSVIATQQAAVFCRLPTMATLPLLSVIATQQAAVFCRLPTMATLPLPGVVCALPATVATQLPPMAVLPLPSVLCSFPAAVATSLPPMASLPLPVAQVDSSLIILVDGYTVSSSITMQSIANPVVTEATEYQGTFALKSTSNITVSDAHTARDIVAFIHTMSVTDSFNSYAEAVLQGTPTISINDTHSMTSPAVGNLVATYVVNDVHSYTSEVAGIYDITVDYSYSAAEQYTVTALASLSVSEQATALAQLIHSAVVTVAVDDAYQSTESTEFQATALIAVAELVNSLSAVDTANKSFYTYALNTLLGATTRYGNYGFNSFAATDEACYGANDTGLYLLEGNNDAGYTIPAGFRTNVTDLRTEEAPEGARPRSVQYAYLGMTSSGELRLKASAANGGVTGTRTYRVRQTGDTFDNTTRVVMGKGVQARYWQFTLENVHGEAFDIDQIELLPVARTRRI